MSQVDIRSQPAVIRKILDGADPEPLEAEPDDDEEENEEERNKQTSSDNADEQRPTVIPQEERSKWKRLTTRKN